MGSIKYFKSLDGRNAFEVKCDEILLRAVYHRTKEGDSQRNFLNIDHFGNGLISRKFKRTFILYLIEKGYELENRNGFFIWAFVFGYSYVIINSNFVE